MQVERVYRQPTAASRAVLEQARVDRDVPTIREAIIALVSAERDRQWMERQLIDLMQDVDGSVRSIAALAVGHLARLHRQMELNEIMLVLERLLKDDEARGNAANAIDDITTFVTPRRWPTTAGYARPRRPVPSERPRACRTRPGVRSLFDSPSGSR